MKTYLDDEQRKKDEGPPSSYTPRSEMPEEEPSSAELPEYAVPEKCSVIEQLRISIVSAKQLVGLSELKVSRFVRYVILLCFLVSIMLTVVPAAATIASFGGFSKLFNERMPAFEVKNGEFRVEEPFSLVIGSCEIVMNSAEDTVAQDKFLGKLVTIAIGKKRMQVVLSQNGLSEVALDQPISAYFEDGFDKSMLNEAIPGFYIAIGIMTLFTMLWTAIRYCLAALIYMLLSWALVKQTNLDLNKGNVFRLCFYAQTIGILLVNLNQATGYLIPSFIVSIIGIFITFRWILKSVVKYLNIGRQGY